MAKLRYYIDWLFRDLTTRRGKYVIAEVPNPPLIVFMVTVILSIALYPGAFRTLCSIVAFISLFYWGFLEYRSGRSRFRKLLGILSMVAVGVALVLGL